MKTLPQMLNDLRGLSSLMLESASQIDEIVMFFGGVSGQVTVAPPSPPPARLLPSPDPSPLRVHDSVVEKPKKPRGAGKSRALTVGEKAAVRRDWEMLPPHQRSVINRQALAAKHQITAQHVYALTRENPPLKAFYAQQQQQQLSQ